MAESSTDRVLRIHHVWRDKNGRYHESIGTSLPSYSASRGPFGEIVYNVDTEEPEQEDC